MVYLLYHACIIMRGLYFMYIKYYGIKFNVNYI